MSTTSRPASGWTLGLVLTTALALTATPATSQVVDPPDRDPVAVQTGSGLPFDGQIEVQLAARAQGALRDGGGWKALERR
ncbi:MAG: hypothetical protein R3326_03470 [Gemmatimonadota bacterium]|nr:hypothetical protein [Gemmatimonadota bacterium]